MQCGENHTQKINNRGAVNIVLRKLPTHIEIEPKKRLSHYPETASYTTDCI